MKPHVMLYLLAQHRHHHHFYAMARQQKMMRAPLLGPSLPPHLSSEGEEFDFTEANKILSDDDSGHEESDLDRYADPQFYPKPGKVTKFKGNVLAQLESPYGRHYKINDNVSYPIIYCIDRY